MSIRLVAEVLDDSPSNLTAQERLLLVCLAEWANDDTRECWPGPERIMRRMRASSWDAVAKVLRGLAAKGCEVRVPITRTNGVALVDRTGRPVFAANGHQSVYRIPPMRRSAESADQDQGASKLLSK